MYCDGECTPEQRVQVDQATAGDPQMQARLRQQLDGNARLKKSLCALSGKSEFRAPSGLRQRLNAAFDQAGESVEPLKMTARRWRFAGWLQEPRRANAFAVAATLLLVAGAVLYGIFGRSIDEVGPLDPNAVFAEAAKFAESEHNRCAGSDQVLREKARINELSTAEADLGRWVGAPVRIADLSDLHYEFVGAGHCSMPVSPRSGHILYRHTSRISKQAPMVSVFVFPNRGLCGGNLCQGMDCHCWYPCVSDECKHRVLRSTDGKLVYVLVCCNDGDIDAVAETIKRALHPDGH
jgi:anti-sigma factor RsiW